MKNLMSKEVKNIYNILRRKGYFIINGNEKFLRMLILARRHDIIALYRTSFSAIGQGYTAYATQLRSVKEDETSQTITCHYLSDGNCTVRFWLNGSSFFIPYIVLLKVPSLLLLLSPINYLNNRH